MNRSPKTFFAAALALAALACAGSPAASWARATRHGHTRHHAAKSCRGSRCAADTGGTPAMKPPETPRSTPAVKPPRTPRSTRRTREASPRQSSPKSLTPTAAAAPTEDEAPEQDKAAVIAAVLATPCANTELTPNAEDLQLVKGAVLCLINRERAEHGVSPLIANPRLEEAAEGHCAELISDDYFAHISPSGETPVERIRKTGYIPAPSDGFVIGENLAWGTYSLSTPASIVAAWIASPGHLANILESQYTETGIGIVPAVPASLADGSPGASYAQEFGVIVP